MTELRDYQKDDTAKIEAALDAGAKVLYVLPTGAGKTVVAAAIVERARQADKRVLMLTHRREILRQTSFKIPFEHGLIQAGLNIDLSYSIQIASIPTLWSRSMLTNKVPLPAANVLIIDEAHHIAAETWHRIFEAYPNARRLGLTATPCRGDGRGLGNYFTKIIEGPQIPELIAQKYLVPTVYYAPAEPDLKGVETRQGDYAKNQLADRMNRKDLVGDIVSNWHKYGQRRKTLVFCVDVAHSVHVKDEFLKSGVRAEHVDSSTPTIERDAILARLASGETELVANCMVLTEGFDLPAISCIILARPTKLIGLFRQMAGRGLRPAPGKTNLILIDHSGAVYRHGLLEDPIKWTLETDKRAENPIHETRSQKAISRLVDCSKCGALRKGGEACGNCGFLPKRRPDAIIFRDGELARVDRNGRPIKTSDPNERMRFHAMLKFIQQQRGRHPGWVFHSYRAKFGSEPPVSIYQIDPIPPSAEVLSWVRSRDIAYAKAKQKAAGAA
jgi:DNA repair protein RadD